MKQILKLYKYYLKKLLKSWYFWLFLAFGLAYAFGLPYLAYKNTANYLVKSGINNYKDYLKWLNGIGPATKGIGREPGFWHPFASITKEFLLLKTGQDSWKEFLTVIWKFTCWGLTGILITSFFVAPAIASLVSQPAKDGEDKTALNVASPIKRDDLVISKFLAFLTYFCLGSFLVFGLPYFIYSGWLTGNWTIGLIFLFFSSLIFALPIFLLFYAVLFLLDSLSTILRLIFSVFLGLVPLLWVFLKVYLGEWGNKSELVENLSKFGANFWIIIPLALLIGGLFLFLYRERFRKKDFN